MSILIEAYTRNLVFFGVIDVLIALWCLYGLTKIIDHQSTKSDRIKGIGIVIVAIILLLIVNLLAIHFTHK
ncbi:hypothetical protein HGK75_00800 [uncultured bacterium]|uniref:hypothetical protein n=1 Tax=Acetilactobacillus jinshanensis TaxID=1720083 RepID=UPI0021893C0D|nr:hypothetical protein HGK75_00800 [uncultured bacterium]